jgi:hypothetical protein
MAAQKSTSLIGSEVRLVRNDQNRCWLTIPVNLYRRFFRKNGMNQPGKETESESELI